MTSSATAHDGISRAVKFTLSPEDLEAVILGEDAEAAMNALLNMHPATYSCAAFRWGSLACKRIFEILKDKCQSSNWEEALMYAHLILNFSEGQLGQKRQRGEGDAAIHLLRASLAVAVDTFVRHLNTKEAPTLGLVMTLQALCSSSEKLIRSSSGAAILAADFVNINGEAKEFVLGLFTCATYVSSRIADAEQPEAATTGEFALLQAKRASAELLRCLVVLSSDVAAALREMHKPKDAIHNGGKCGDPTLQGILNELARFMGVSVQPHANAEVACVFGCTLVWGGLKLLDVQAVFTPFSLALTGRYSNSRENTRIELPWHCIENAMASIIAGWPLRLPAKCLAARVARAISSRHAALIGDYYTRLYLSLPAPTFELSIKVSTPDEGIHCLASVVDILRRKFEIPVENASGREDEGKSLVDVSTGTKQIPVMQITNSMQDKKIESPLESSTGNLAGHEGSIDSQALVENGQKPTNVGETFRQGSIEVSISREIPVNNASSSIQKEEAESTPKGSTCNYSNHEGGIDSKTFVDPSLESTSFGGPYWQGTFEAVGSKETPVQNVTTSMQKERTESSLESSIGDGVGHDGSIDSQTLVESPLNSNNVGGSFGQGTFEVVIPREIPVNSSIPLVQDEKVGSTPKGTTGDCGGHQDSNDSQTRLDNPPSSTNLVCHVVPMEIPTEIASQSRQEDTEMAHASQKNNPERSEAIKKKMKAADATVDCLKHSGTCQRMSEHEFGVPDELSRQQHFVASESPSVQKPSSHPVVTAKGPKPTAAKSKPAARQPCQPSSVPAAAKSKPVVGQACPPSPVPIDATSKPVAGQPCPPSPVPTAATNKPVARQQCPPSPAQLWSQVGTPFSPLAANQPLSPFRVAASSPNLPQPQTPRSETPDRGSGDLGSLPLTELRTLCGEYQISARGTRPELVERIMMQRLARRSRTRMASPPPLFAQCSRAMSPSSSGMQLLAKTANAESAVREQARTANVNDGAQASASGRSNTSVSSRSAKREQSSTGASLHSSSTRASCNGLETVSSDCSPKKLGLENAVAEQTHQGVELPFSATPVRSPATSQAFEPFARRTAANDQLLDMANFSYGWIPSPSPRRSPRLASLESVRSFQRGTRTPREPSQAEDQSATKKPRTQQKSQIADVAAEEPGTQRFLRSEPPLSSDSQTVASKQTCNQKLECAASQISKLPHARLESPNPSRGTYSSIPSQPTSDQRRRRLRSKSPDPTLPQSEKLTSTRRRLRSKSPASAYWDSWNMGAAPQAAPAGTGMSVLRRRMRSKSPDPMHRFTIPRPHPEVVEALRVIPVTHRITSKSPDPRKREEPNAAVMALSSLRPDQIRAACQTRGLSPAGSIKDVVRRLMKFLSAASVPEPRRKLSEGLASPSSCAKIETATPRVERHQRRRQPEVATTPPPVAKQAFSKQPLQNLPACSQSESKKHRDWPASTSATLLDQHPTSTLASGSPLRNRSTEVVPTRHALARPEEPSDRWVGRLRQHGQDLLRRSRSSTSAPVHLQS